MCVEDGTTTIDTVRSFFPVRVVVPVQSRVEKFQGLVTGACNAVAGDSTEVLPASVVNARYSGPYEMGQRRFSDEPLTPLTREDDPEWSDFVYWVVSSMFYAEEEGITQATLNLMPQLSLFGSRFFNAYRFVIQAVGNLGEIHNRDLGPFLNRTGANLLNLSPNGPQHFVRPGL